MGTAVQDSHHLTITLDRHPSDRTFGRDLDDFNPHLLGEFATPGCEAFLKFRVQIVEESHVALFPSMPLGRLTL